MAKFERKTKEERKTEIMDAAKKVFLSKGYRYATMEDIVAATSLSKGGVYQYYKSTKAIMFDIMQRGNYFRYRRTEEVIASIPETDDMAEINSSRYSENIRSSAGKTALHYVSV